MSLESGLLIIKKMIMMKPRTLFKLPFQVENYKEVIKKLKIYKERNIIVMDEEIKFVVRRIFDFHINNATPALVFYSLGNKNALVMGKVKGKTINILLPIDDMVCNFETSFLATYVA